MPEEADFKIGDLVYAPHFGFFKVRAVSWGKGPIPLAEDEEDWQYHVDNVKDGKMWGFSQTFARQNKIELEYTDF